MPGRRVTGRTVWLLAIVFIALLLRGLIPLLATTVSADPDGCYAPDSRSYAALARGLLRTGRLGPRARPEIVRTPGYPAFLLPGLLAGRFEAATIALQVLLSCATVYLVYRIALLLFGRPDVAAAAGLLYAVEPLSVVYCGLLLSETLFTFLLALFLWGLLAHLHSKKTGWLLAAGAAAAAMAFVRPIGYFLPALVWVGLMYRAALSRPKSWRKLVQAVVFLLVACGPLAAWQTRNAVKTGYAGFSAIADVNLYFYHGAATLAAVRGNSYYETQRQLGYQSEEQYLKAHPAQADWSRAERFRYMRRETLNIVTANPLIWTKLYLKGLARMMLDPGAFEYLKLFGAYREGGGLLGRTVDRGVIPVAMELYQERPAVFWTNLGLGLLLAFYLLAAARGLLSRVLTNSGALVCLGVAVYLAALSGGPQAVGRFRHPLMPAICLAGGAGICLVLNRFKRRQEES
jgi:4-amino-4-deoxy-L-arabinose transferase-like glycosyltransferase